MDTNGYIVITVAIAMVFFLLYTVVVVPQNRARKRQEQVVDELKIGEEVVTVGGLIGRLTYLNREEDLAKIEIAKGIEVRIIPASISHPLDFLDRVRRQEREAKSKPAANKTKA